MSQAVLLVNLGTPESLSLAGVRRFLRDFLWDKGVVSLPRFIWGPILFGLVLPFRTKRTLKLYEQIWTDKGSPLLVNTLNLGKALDSHLKKLNHSIPVFTAMTYGNPNLKSILQSILEMSITEIWVIPLFPCYAGQTTDTILNHVTQHLSPLSHPKAPRLRFIRDYSTHPLYLRAIAKSIENHWNIVGTPAPLLFSFHGVPRLRGAANPYVQSCHALAHAVAGLLKLNGNEWSVGFQSRFGLLPWTRPSTESQLIHLRKRGEESVDVIAPSFAVDCLETLEELGIRAKETFLNAGGKHYRYIGALNDNNEHVDVLASLLIDEI